MSSTPHVNTPAPTRTTDTPPTTPTSFALANAQRTFDPFNTDDCPQLFADKWTADEE